MLISIYHLYWNIVNRYIIDITRGTHENETCQENWMEKEDMRREKAFAIDW